MSGDAGLEPGQAFNGSLRVGIEGTAVDATGFQGLFCFDQIVFGRGQLVFKKQAALLGFRHRNAVEQGAQFFNVGVGQLGGKGGICVAGVDAD